MNSTTKPNHRLAFACSLAALVCAILFLTYGGTLISTDEMILFDATESVARGGGLDMNLTTAIRETETLDDGAMQALAASPLFWLIERIPGVGMVHGLLVFNNLITGATAALLFMYALALGYRTRTALAAGLLFALATIAWPYSKTFFSEPLLGFCLLLAAYALERFRQGFLRVGVLRWPWLTLALAAFVAAVFTKQAAVLALPALAMLIVPGWSTFTRRGQTAQLFRVVITAATIATTITIPIASNRILSALDNASLEWLLKASIGYTFSPGQGMFTFSPILLLGLAGLFMLARQHRWRYVLMPTARLVGFVVGYAILRHEQWFAGKGWGPRYTVPLTAFLLLPALPVIQHALSQRRTWARAGFVALALLSFAIQLVGTLVPVDDYYERIHGGTAWDVGVWVPDQTQIVINTGLLLSGNALDVAWVRTGLDLAIPALCGLAAAASVAAMRYLGQGRAHNLRRAAAVSIAAVALTGSLFLFALTRYTARDEHYLVEDARLHQMLDYLNHSAGTNDVIVLSNPRYQWFFYNFNKRPGLDIVVLPNSPGERPSPEQPAQVVSDNPEHLIEKRIARKVHRLADTYETLWLLVDGSRYVTWSVRPVEQWMTRHFFPIEEHEVTPQVRVVRYSTASPPPPAAPPWPQAQSNAVFGDTFRLMGYDLIGTPFHPGELINVSLMWEVVRAPATDYSVGLLVADADGATRAERHSEPLGGFEQTYFWQPGEYWRDNHAIRLPADLPAGRYRLRLILYTWHDGQRLPVVSAEGNPPGDVLELGSIEIGEGG